MARSPSYRPSIASCLRQHKWLYFMLIPGVLYYVIFRFYPFSYLIIIFQDFFPTLGIRRSPWVGLQNFISFFTGGGVWGFPVLFRNTILLAFYNLLFYFPVPIILSLLLNEVRHSWFKRLTQSLVYLPHFLSWTVLVGIFYLFFGPIGVISTILRNQGGRGLDILIDPAWFRSLIVIQLIWKEAGWGTIVYLAALAGVDEQLYEASTIDGAGRAQQLWHITLPSIRSTIIILLILRMGSFMDIGFEQIFLMRNSLNRSVAEVFDTYVFVRGVREGFFSHAATVGVFKSTVSLILVLLTNKLAAVFGEEGVF